MIPDRERLILLVEDEPINVLLIRRALDKVGQPIQVTTAENGEQAVRYLSDRQNQPDLPDSSLPDLVLTDIKMPRMNGMELLAWIRQQPTLAHLPVVVLSSSGEPEDISRATQLGANSYLVRPGSSSEMVEMMRQIVTAIP